MPLKQDEVKNFKELLTKEKNRLEESVNMANEAMDATETRSGIADASGGDSHLLDVANDVMEHEMQNTLRLAIRDRLDRVNRCLQRIEAGQYGNCAICGKDIETNRLRAIPYSELCMECELNNEDMGR